MILVQNRKDKMKLQNQLWEKIDIAIFFFFYYLFWVIDRTMVMLRISKDLPDEEWD